MNIFNYLLILDKISIFSKKSLNMETLSEARIAVFKHSSEGVPDPVLSDQNSCREAEFAAM